MTRISLHDLLLDEDTEKKEIGNEILHDLLSGEYEDPEKKEIGNEKKKSKKAFMTLPFLIRFDGYKYNRYCSIPIEGAKKLTLKQFIRYVVSLVNSLGLCVSSSFSLSPQHVLIQ